MGQCKFSRCGVPLHNDILIHTVNQHEAEGKVSLRQRIFDESIEHYTVKPVYSGHLGEIDEMTTIYRWPLYEGVWLFDEIFYISCK